MSTPTPTPRTYAAKIKSGFAAIPDGFYDHARGLETELAALAAECDQLRAECEKAKKQFEILNKTLQHVTDMYVTATKRAERAEASICTLFHWKS
jgi:chromosome segregation ATPase